jgi:hypothetical protein
MEKCELSAVDVSTSRWPEKDEVVSGNFTMFYSDEVKAQKDVAIVFKNDTV